jgi:transposase-like protein
MTPHRNTSAAPRTLVEASNTHPFVFILDGGRSAASTSREIPYSEVYRESTSKRETPAQRLQRVTSMDSTATA